MLPLIAVLVFGWDVGALVTLYWSESLIVGGITLLKMFHKKGPKALPMMAFFSIHYGFFCVGHVAILSEVLQSSPVWTGGGFGGDGATASFDDSLIGPALTVFQAATPMWLLAFFALIASHVVSLYYNYLGRAEYRSVDLGDLMVAPYKRIIIMHIAVLAGAALVVMSGSKAVLLILLVFLKTGVDAFAHYREHRTAGMAYAKKDFEM